MKKILLFVLVLFSGCCWGQVRFQKVFGTNGVARPNIKTTTDGGYIISGSIYSGAFLIKINEYGDTLWSKTYYGTGGLSPERVIQTKDGGFLFCGTAVSDVTGILIKTDSLGNLQWAKYGFASIEPGSQMNSVTETFDGNYFYSGARSGSFPPRLFLEYGKVDINGNDLPFVAAFPSYTPPYISEYGRDIIQTSDSGFVFCVSTDTGSGWPKIYLARINASNNFLWSKLISANMECQSSELIKTADGGFALCGSAGNQFLVFRIDINGNVIWAKTYGDGYARSMRQTLNGDLIITGYVPSVGVVLIRVDIYGNLIFGKKYGGTSDTGHAIDISNDGGFIIAGRTNIFGGNKIYLIKTDAFGNSGCNETNYGPIITTPALTIQNHTTFLGGTQQLNTQSITYGTPLNDSSLCFQICSLSVSINNTSIFCNGDTTASATTNPSNGTEPYTYSWSTGDTTQTIYNLAAGSYTVTVQDSNACIISEVVTITEPAPVTATVCLNTPVLCHGESTGCAAICTSGGTLPYTYSWIPGGLPDDDTLCSMLSAGCYTCFVSDSNGCSDTVVFCITEPPPLTDSIVSFDTPCYNSPSGIAAVYPSGGTGPYSYSWSNGETFWQTVYLLPGTYYVTVTDSNECTVTDSAIVNSPSPISATITISDASCSVCNDGSAIVNPLGGTPPYSYSWNTTPVQYGQTATALLPGVYTCCITDANGCTECFSDTVGFTVGMNDSQGINFSIHPNPTNSSFLISFDKVTAVHISVYDLLGNRIKEVTAKEAQVEVDLSGYSEGVYQVRIAIGGAARMQKVILIKE
jgi:hypothetical protein